MNSYLYLILDILTLAFPLGASFDKRFVYHQKFKYLFPSIVIVAIPFLIWDVIFTRKGIWGFNSEYLMGIDLIDLPIEEWLFFIIIPFSCVFIYECVKYFKGGLINKKSHKITVVLIIGLMTIALMNLERSYTSVTFISLSVCLFLFEFILRVKWLYTFYIAFLWILIPFFLVNGVLTGAGIEDQIVWYNNSENLNIRMYTIPVEDTFYGMLLLVLNISLFEFFKTKY